MSLIGSRKALEDIRHKVTSNALFRLRTCEEPVTTVHTFYYGSTNYYRFFYRKLDNTTFWVMTIISTSVYHSCQDLVRGIRLSESQRKKETSGELWNHLPIYFLFRAADLFTTDEAMQQFMGMESYEKYVALLSNPAFVDILYKKMSLCSRLPFLREWMEPLLQIRAEASRYNFITLESSGMIRQHDTTPKEDKIFTFKAYFNEKQLQEAITECFRRKMITTGTDVTTGDVSETRTLTQYLDKFSDNLVQKAHERFHPLYTPGISTPTKKALSFFANAEYFSDLNYFAAQRDVICSVAKGLARNKRTLIVGECGIGKTSIALASIYTHTQKKNPVTMVMCPGHMVEEWKKEILRLYPFAEAHIVEKLNQLQKFEPIIRQKKATSPLFLIFGKDSCKMEYDERPYLHWNDRKNQYELPNKKYVEIKKTDRTNYRSAKRYMEQLMYFLKPTSKNQYAFFNAGGHITTEYKKNTKLTKLWTAASSNNGEWVKIAKVGWVNTLLAKAFVARVDRMAANGEEIATDILKAYDIAAAALDQETAKPLVRCNLSDYVCRRMKNCIDYFIADEVHLYSSKDTAQGKAFSNLVNTAKHTIALTGTLLNGYAENIFSMLFKLYSRTFIRNGFSFSDTRDFAKEYGVVDTIREYAVIYDGYNSSGYHRQEKMQTKYRPGISPLLFSKFLLDKAVFVTLADITSDLPNYHELPIGVEMDSDAAVGYQQLYTDFRNALREHPDEKDQFLLKTIRRMNMYPDQPYNQAPVFNNETGEQILCPLSIQRQPGKVYASAKDQKLLELVQKHKENGEKVLVYVHWINKLDCVSRIQSILTEHGIKSAFLTASISARARQKWISDKVKEGIDVLICNPSLVETGLNLLDFTTIIFYQMDDKLFTLRQASRRSLRLNQSHDVTVYILYFKDTVQENIICLMANKLQAAMAIEGKFSEEGLNAMGDTDSILNQLANNLTKDIDMKLEAGAFDFHTIEAETSGNRFKGGIGHDQIKNWIYKIEHESKKKQQTINIDSDLAWLTGS